MGAVTGGNATGMTVTVVELVTVRFVPGIRIWNAVSRQELEQQAGEAPADPHHGRWMQKDN